MDHAKSNIEIEGCGINDRIITIKENTETENAEGKWSCNQEKGQILGFTPLDKLFSTVQQRRRYKKINGRDISL